MTSEDQQEIQDEIKTALQWPRKNYKRTKHSKPHTWRTRRDPFETVNNEILLAVQLAPNIQANQLMAELQVRHPGMFKGNEVRTLRRRLKDLRTELCQREQLNLEYATITGD
jgi:hypothetical protein